MEFRESISIQIIAGYLMKKIFLPVLIILFLNCCYAQQQFQLAPPMLKSGSVFFRGSAIVQLQFAQPGTRIFYTLNNTEPLENDSVYSKPIVIKKSLTTLKAKVFGKGYLPSEIVEATFIKDGLKIKSIEQPGADEKFTGNGPQTLFDNEGGVPDLHNKNFLGYQKDSIEINVTLEKKEKINSVLLNFLQDHGSWIFLPQKIEVMYFDIKKNMYVPMGKKEIPVDTIIKGSSTVYEIIRAGKKISSDKLKIVLKPVQSLPGGHPGVGKQSWLFIDEIKIY